jgi:hypothetical protein
MMPDGAAQRRLFCPGRWAPLPFSCEKIAASSPGSMIGFLFYSSLVG